MTKRRSWLDLKYARGWILNFMAQNGDCKQYELQACITRIIEFIFFSDCCDWTHASG